MSRLSNPYARAARLLPRLAPYISKKTPFAILLETNAILRELGMRRAERNAKLTGQHLKKLDFPLVK